MSLMVMQILALLQLSKIGRGTTLLIIGEVKGGVGSRGVRAGGGP